MAGPDEGGRDEDYLLTTREVAGWLKLSTRQVLRLPIRRLKLGYRTIRYREEDVRRYVSNF